MYVYIYICNSIITIGCYEFYSHIEVYGNSFFEGSPSQNDAFCSRARLRLPFTSRFLSPSCAISWDTAAARISALEPFRMRRNACVSMGFGGFRWSIEALVSSQDLQGEARAF